MTLSIEHTDLYRWHERYTQHMYVSFFIFSKFKHSRCYVYDVLYGCISPWSCPWVLAGWFCARRNPMSQWCNLQHQRWKLRPGVAVNWGLPIFQWFMALGKMIFKNSEVLRGKMKQDETDVLFVGVGKRSSYPSRRVDRRLAGGVVKKLGWIKGAACFLWWGERMQMWSMERCRKNTKNLLSI